MNHSNNAIAYINTFKTALEGGQNGDEERKDAGNEFQASTHR
jgi:hypothetical protein